VGIGGNILFETTNEGPELEAYQPRPDAQRSHQAGAGGRRDHQGQQRRRILRTIFTVAESPLEQGLIWTGSDDGLVHVTRDGGKHWTNVTPKDMPEWIQINSIEASPHDAQTAYVAATMYKWDDFRPVPVRHARYRQDLDGHQSRHPGPLLHARGARRSQSQGPAGGRHGTGMFISFNGGENWKPFQLNLPVVPITDLAFHKREQELVVATQGRAFWILDDVPLLYQLSPAALKDRRTCSSRRMPCAACAAVSRFRPARPVGQNPAGGVAIYYSLAAKPKEKEEITLEILDADGKLVKKYSNIEKKDEGPGDPEEEAFGPPRGAEKLPAEAGLNRFVWNLRYEDSTKFPRPDHVGWQRGRDPPPRPASTPRSSPWEARARHRRSPCGPIRALKTRPEDYAAQLALALQLRDKLSAVNQAVIEIREAKKQLARYEKEDKVKDAARLSIRSWPRLKTRFIRQS
jgi:hypothetical protein